MTTELMILAQIRSAVGDPEGRLMQDDLVKTIKAMSDALDLIETLTAPGKVPKEDVIRIHKAAWDALYNRRMKGKPS